MSEQDVAVLAQWVVAVRPLFANRVIWARDPEMAAIRRRLIAERRASAEAGGERKTDD